MTHKTQKLTQERLKEVLRYDPATGIFYWKMKTSKCVRIGSVAGTNDGGYIFIRIDNVKFAAGRLAFLYMTGKFPQYTCDHFDRNPSNNMWSNLRDATYSQQNVNRKKQIKKYNLPHGVELSGKKFRARIRRDGKMINLGTFDTIEEASKSHMFAVLQFDRNETP